MPEDQEAGPRTVDTPTRQCGRCRLRFEGDPTLDAAAPTKWWLCPTCRAILLGDRDNPAFRSVGAASSRS